MRDRLTKLRRHRSPFRIPECFSHIPRDVFTEVIIRSREARVRLIITHVCKTSMFRCWHMVCVLQKWHIVRTSQTVASFYALVRQGEEQRNRTELNNKSSWNVSSDMKMD